MDRPVLRIKIPRHSYGDDDSQSELTRFVDGDGSTDTTVADIDSVRAGSLGSIEDVGDNDLFGQFFRDASYDENRISAKVTVQERAGLKGFENVANTCWLNSIVQMLLHSEKFVHALNSVHTPLDLPLFNAGLEKLFGTGILNELAHIKDAYYGGERMYTLDKLREVMSLVGPNAFSFGIMQDAHEGLRAVLGSLPDALVDADLLPGQLGVDLFGIEKLSMCEFTVCSDSVSNTEQLVELGVSIPQVGSLLMELLVDELKSEEVVRKCAECGCEGTGTLSSWITKLPPILIVHLKRFDQFGNKIETSVEIPVVMNFAEIEGYTHGFYKLVGIVHHMGTTAIGHYYTDFAFDGTWFRANDARISNKPPTLDGPTPYILLYEQVSTVEELNEWELIHQKVIQTSKVVDLANIGDDLLFDMLDHFSGASEKTPPMTWDGFVGHGDPVYDAYPYALAKHETVDLTHEDDDTLKRNSFLGKRKQHDKLVRIPRFSQERQIGSEVVMTDADITEIAGSF